MDSSTDKYLANRTGSVSLLSVRLYLQGSRIRRIVVCSTRIYKTPTSALANYSSVESVSPPHVPEPSSRPGSSGLATPRKKWYKQEKEVRSQETLATLIGAACLGSPDAVSWDAWRLVRLHKYLRKSITKASALKTTGRRRMAIRRLLPRGAFDMHKSVH